MAEQAQAYAIQFGRAGMVAHEDRWLATADEVAVAENVTFENDYAQPEPAAVSYDATGLSSEQPSGTLDISTDSATAALWLPAASTAAYLGLVSKVCVATTSPLTGIGVLMDVAVGRTLVVLLGQTLHPTDNPLATSVTDTVGNVYTRARTVPGGGGVNAEIELWVSTITTLLPAAGGALSVVYTSAASDDRTVVALAFADVSASAAATSAGFADTSAAFTGTVFGAQQYPAMLVGGVQYLADSTVSAHWIAGWTSRAVANHAAPPSSSLDAATKFLPFAAPIIAQVDWKSDATSAPAGTVSTTPNGTTVTGVGTNFTATFRPGDEIVAGGETNVVASVTSTTVLDTVAVWVTLNAGVAFERRAGPRIITATLTGKLFKDTPDNNSNGNTGNLDAQPLKSGLTTTRHRGRFVSGGKEVAANARKLFYFNGVDPVQVLAGDGNTTSNIATPPADWAAAADAGKEPVNALVHRGRLVGFGNLNDPHRIYFSDTASHEVFTGANAFQISLASNIGERLYGAAEFQGVAFFWKYPAGIFYLDDIDPDFANWGYRTRSEALGCCASPHAVLPVDQDVIFCTADGHFHLLSAVSDLGGQRDSDLTRRLGLHTWTKENIDTTRLDQLCSVWNPVTKQALFGMRSTAATTFSNDLLLRWDFGLVDRGGPIRFSYARAWVPNALCVKRRGFVGTPSLLIGETLTSMFIDPDSYGYRVDGGSTITGFSQTVTTPALDFADADGANRGRRKSFRAIELIRKRGLFVADPLPTTMTVLVDGVQRNVTTIASMGVGTRRARYDLKVGDGFDVQITLANATTSGSLVGDTRDFDLGWLGAIIWYVPGGQQHNRRS